MEEKDDELYVAQMYMPAGLLANGDITAIRMDVEARVLVERSVHDKLERILAWIDAQEGRDGSHAAQDPLE